MIHSIGLKKTNAIKDKSSSVNIYIDFICKLEGWKTKCKNLHWSAPRKNIHVYLDEFLEVLSNYQDSLAEEYMGIFGQMGPSEIFGHPCECIDAQIFINMVSAKTLEFYKTIQDKANVELKGIVSECESFIHNINKYKYLFSLCK